MLKFEHDQFLAKAHSLTALRGKVEELVDSLPVRGITSIHLIGAGGTWAQMLPYDQYLRTKSTIPVRTHIAAELIETGDSLLDEHALAVFTSVSGTTDDVVRAIAYCKELGALTVGFTGYPESPIATTVDVPMLSLPEAWPFDIQMLLLTTALLNRHGAFPEYEKFVTELEGIPEILVAVAEQGEVFAQAYAEAHKDTDWYHLVGAGNTWGFAYLYSMCILEEMQWLRTTRVHGAEFFHGSLELLEKDTAVLLFMGEDDTRPLMERVDRFARKVSDDVMTIDTKDYPLEGISPQFRYLYSPLVLDTVLSRLSKHLERVRDHSLDLRRYYRVVEY